MRRDTYCAAGSEGWREFRLAGGFGLFLLIAAPWHVLAGIRNRGFFWFYFVNEHFLRFLGKRYPMDYNKLPPLAYWGLTLVCLPWSLFRRLSSAPEAAGPKLRAASRPPAAPYFGICRGLELPGANPAVCWVWSGVVLSFFAFSTNQEYYTFPAYLPLLILLAGALSAEEEANPGSRWLFIPNIVNAVGVALGGILIAGLWASRSKPFISDIGTVMADRNVGNNTLR